jgi:hypothetical protein
MKYGRIAAMFAVVADEQRSLAMTRRREWVKMRVDEWKKENMDIIKSAVDRLFENADWSGEDQDNPVVNSRWLKGYNWSEYVQHDDEFKGN